MMQNANSQRLAYGSFEVGEGCGATILAGSAKSSAGEVQAENFSVWTVKPYVKITSTAPASDWAKLQQALVNGEAASLTCEAFEHTFENGTNFVKLLKDVVANTDVDTCLVIASGSRAVLDLNGQTLDRGLSALEDEGGMQSGHVISVFGELTVTDKGKANDGRITGGYGVECGGVAIGGSSKAEGTDVVARFVLEDGAIVGNKSSTEDDGCSGGVLVNNGEFLMRWPDC